MHHIRFRCEEYGVDGDVDEKGVGGGVLLAFTSHQISITHINNTLKLLRRWRRYIYIDIYFVCRVLCCEALSLLLPLPLLLVLLVSPPSTNEFRSLM